MMLCLLFEEDCPESVRLRPKDDSRLEQHRNRWENMVLSLYRWSRRHAVGGLEGNAGLWKACSCCLLDKLVVRGGCKQSEGEME